MVCIPKLCHYAYTKKDFLILATLKEEHLSELKMKKKGHHQVSPQAPGLTPASHQVPGNLAMQQATSELFPSEGTGHPEARCRQENH